MITCSILWISECHGTNLTVKLRWATAGVPHVTVVGYAGGLAINKCTSASAGIGCIGVYRRDSLDTLMQEERAHFRV